MKHPEARTERETSPRRTTDDVPRNPARRTFLTGTLGTFGAVLFPPSALESLAAPGRHDVVEIDLTTIPVGDEVMIEWRGRPLFVRHRRPKEIEAARAADLETLRDPEPDDARTSRPEWLVVIGVCTHMGCTPLSYEGKFGGWFCACHSSTYDTSGRVRSGPAPANLAVPPYEFLDGDRLRIG